MSPDDEFDEYVRETAHLPLFASDRTDFFSPYHAFMLNVLSMVRDAWPTPGPTWYDMANACAEDRVARDEVRACRLEVVAYWKARVARPFGEAENQEEAAIVLFHCALEHREDSGWLRKSSAPLIMQAIDFYSETFIRQFGRSRELLDLLRRTFAVAPV